MLLIDGELIFFMEEVPHRLSNPKRSALDTYKILAKLKGLSKLYTHICIYYVYMRVYTFKNNKDEIMNFGEGTKRVGGKGRVNFQFRKKYKLSMRRPW